MGQNASKSSANNSMAYFNGRENGGHAKIAINGKPRSASYGQLHQKSDKPKADQKGVRSSDRKKKVGRESRSASETKSLLEKQFEAEVIKEHSNGRIHTNNNHKQATGQPVLNGDIRYRNVMKDSASETEDHDSDNIGKRLSQHGLNGRNSGQFEAKRAFYRHGNNNLDETTSFVRNTEHVPDSDYDNFVRNGMKRHSVDTVENVNRKYEDFVARVRQESQNIYGPQSAPISAKGFHGVKNPYGAQNGHGGPKADGKDYNDGIYERISNVSAGIEQLEVGLCFYSFAFLTPYDDSMMEFVMIIK